MFFFIVLKANKKKRNVFLNEDVARFNSKSIVCMLLTNTRAVLAGAFLVLAHPHCLIVVLQDRGFTSSSNVIKTGKTQSSFQTPGAG